MTTLRIPTSILSGLIFALSSHAATKSPFPAGCRTVGHEFINHLMILKPDMEDHPQTLYMIHNTSAQTIKLQLYKTSGQRYSPNYDNIIAKGEWGVFAMDEEFLPFVCATMAKKEITPVACHDTVEVCQYTRAKFDVANMGNYWVSHSRSLSSAIKESSGDGILLRQ
jgi:hypothetical protein